ncbi:hypothetical protein SDJN03_04831, partial [Cucurbita argyrosperma subsp. sororia]
MSLSHCMEKGRACLITEKALWVRNRERLQRQKGVLKDPHGETIIKRFLRNELEAGNGLNAYDSEEHYELGTKVLVQYKAWNL